MHTKNEAHNLKQEKEALAVILAQAKSLGSTIIIRFYEFLPVFIHRLGWAEDMWPEVMIFVFQK